MSYNFLKKNLGLNLLENVPLSQHTSIGLGGVTDYFYIAKSINDLIETITVAHKAAIPFFVIGKGQEIIFSDQGFEGLIIKNESRNIVVASESSEAIVDSGVDLTSVVNKTASQNLGGLEFLSGNGTSIGGAVYGNLFAHGYSIGDYVKSVTLLGEYNGDINISNSSGSWMAFSYQNSRLKSKLNGNFRPVILTVKLQLVRRRKDEIMKMVQNYWSQNSNFAGEKAISNFFRDPDPKAMAPASYYLDQVGAKKMKVGGAAVSPLNTNCIINRKNAFASDVRKLGDLLRDAVFKKFNLLLEERIEYCGRWQ